MNLAAGRDARRCDEDGRAPHDTSYDNLCVIRGVWHTRKGMSGARFVDKSCPLDWNRACLRLDFIGRDAGFESMTGFSKLGSYSFTKNSALTLTLSPRRGNGDSAQSERQV
jgi:hypothetical protein